MNRVVEYFTDGSVKNNIASAGFIINPNYPNSQSQLCYVSNPNNHYSEVVAIKNALFHICNNSDTKTRYSVITDSDMAFNMISDNRNNQYSELEEIRQILSHENINISLQLCKSHANTTKQITYSKKQGNLLSRKEANRITEGNKRIDRDVRNILIHPNDDISTYHQTPWDIKVK